MKYRTVELVAGSGWENLPKKWRDSGQIILSYRLTPWLITKYDEELIGVLNKASQWEGAPHGETEKGIAILLNPPSSRTSGEIDFLLNLDRKYAIGILG